MNRIVDPPREVPLGLQLKLFEGTGATRSWVCFLPAAIFLSTSAFRSDGATEYRVGILLTGVFLVAMGFRMALPELFKSLGTLRRMRTGLMTTGRIVSCRFEWDGKREQIPYREFLEDWGKKMAQSQGNEFSGCLAKVFLILFGGPVVLTLVVLGIAVAMNHSRLAAGGMMGDLSARDIAAFAGMGLLFIVALVVMVWLLRANMRQAIEQEAGDHRARAGYNAGEDRYTAEIVAQAREQAQDIKLKDPLPQGDSSIELVCRVDYSAMGERRSATGLAPLCNRLDLAGVERLLYDPLDHRKIVLVVGLPGQASTDELGEWRDVPAGAPGIKLALNAAIAVLASWFLLNNALVLSTRFQ